MHGKEMHVRLAALVFSLMGRGLTEAADTVAGAGLELLTLENELAAIGKAYVQPLAGSDLWRVTLPGGERQLYQTHNEALEAFLDAIGFYPKKETANASA